MRRLRRHQPASARPRDWPPQVASRLEPERDGDPVIASAILDRLLHHSITANIRGDSYRLKEKMKAGLLKSKMAATAVAE